MCLIRGVLYYLQVTTCNWLSWSIHDTTRYNRFLASYFFLQGLEDKMYLAVVLFWMSDVEVLTGVFTLSDLMTNFLEANSSWLLYMKKLEKCVCKQWQHKYGNVQCLHNIITLYQSMIIINIHQHQQCYYQQ